MDVLGLSLVPLVPSDTFYTIHMQATETESPVFHFAMADDSMDISSEHGQSFDEDVDIDIDLTTGQVDEDYILEDAASNADFGDDFHQEHLPAIENDDLMIDEEESYHMDDTEFVLDAEGQDMQHENMSVGTADPTNLEHDTVTTEQSESHKEHPTNLFFDPLEGEHIGEDGEEKEPEDFDQSLQFANVHDEANVLQTPQPLDTAESFHDHRTPTPAAQPSPSDDRDDRHAQTGTLDRSTVPNSAEVETKISDSLDDVSSIPHPKYADTLSAVDPELLSRALDVIVTYQGTEYALFSRADSDDPDSFFLSDISIINRPFGELFKSLRHIIQEDITDEDELCISVDELGLKAEEINFSHPPSETSRPMDFRHKISVHDVTLSHILTLYGDLLHNDGDDFRPLYINLETRTSFAKRLSKLIDGAAEGKGLSTMIPWDEQSSNQNDAAEETEHDTGSARESMPPVEAIQDREHDVREDDGLTYVELVQIQEEPVKDERSSDPVVQHAQNGQLHANSLIPEEHSASSTSAPPESLHSQPQKEASTVNDVEDLIDYSEDEDQGVLGQRDDRSNEYDAKNEELRRRSLSRQAEEKNSEGIATQELTTFEQQETKIREGDANHADVENEEVTYPDETEKQYQDTEGSYDNGNEYVEYEREEAEEDGHQSFENTLEGSNYGDPQLYTENLEQHNNDHKAGNPEQVLQENPDDDTNFQAQESISSPHGEEIHLENEANQEEAYPGFPEGDEAIIDSQNVVAGITTQDVQHAPESTASSVEAVGTAESSVTMEPDEIRFEDEEFGEQNTFDSTSDTAQGLAVDEEAENVVATEKVDEIDYEDEDDEEVEGAPDDADDLIGGEAVYRIAESLPNANGKRPLADIEVDGALPSSQDAKRPRP